LIVLEDVVVGWTEQAVETGINFGLGTWRNGATRQGCCSLPKQDIENLGSSRSYVRDRQTDSPAPATQQDVNVGDTARRHRNDTSMEEQFTDTYQMGCLFGTTSD
jgi:hypothetical protein